MNLEERNQLTKPKINKKIKFSLILLQYFTLEYFNLDMVDTRV